MGCFPHVQTHHVGRVVKVGERAGFVERPWGEHPMAATFNVWKG
jgi:hypothetical protein